MIQRFNELSHHNGAIDLLKIIKQFVSGNTLFLEQDDLSVDYATWAKNLAQIKLKVKQKNIQHVLIDCTMNPEIIDKIYNTKWPTRLQCISDLNQICKTYYITSDYTYYYNLEPWVKFFPAFLWTIGTKKIDEYFPNMESRKYTTTYDTSLIKTKSIMCFNRNLSWHRLYLFLLLTERSWFNKISYSFLNKIENRTDAVSIKQFLNEEEQNKIKSLDYLLPILCESEINTNKEKIPIMWFEGSSSVGLPEYCDHAINLITETSVNEGIILTEKTCKPFMAYQIPIVVGPNGANKFLQDIGLDMFEDYIPWRSWDDEIDPKLKIQKIVAFLDQLLSSPTAEQDILQMHEQLHSRLIKNKERFHSQEFLDLLSQQLHLIP
jgi:hypothetical protein